MHAPEPEAPPVEMPTARFARVFRHPVAILAAFAALSVAAYARVLPGWFLSDDAMIAGVVPDGSHVAWSHVANVFVGDWGDRGAWAPIRYYRPLVILSQALDAVVYGVRPWGYHLTNALLHGANGFLLYRVARAARAPSWSAAFAGVAFVVFPWHCESVAWISGRTDVLATTGELACLWLYLEAREAAGARRARLLAGSLVLFAVALASKEPAIVVPALVCAADVVLPQPGPSRRTFLARTGVAWGAFALVALAYLWLRVHSLGSLLGGADDMVLASRSVTGSQVATRWGDNLGRLLRPLNREATGAATAYYSAAFVVSVAAALVALADSAWRRAVPLRLALLAVLWFVASTAPFAYGIHVEPNLANSRFLYFATASASLLLGSLAASGTRASSVVAATLYLGTCFATLHANQEPWIFSGTTMRKVASTYAKTFGWQQDIEPIERLPATYRGAYFALFNASSMVRPFVLDPPRPEAIAKLRAVYDPRRGDLTIGPDPAYGAADLLARDRVDADWLLPLDGSALDTASLEGIERGGGENGARRFTAKSASSWMVFATNTAGGLPPGAGTEERAYLLMRQAPPRPPQIFWVSRPGQQFGAPNYATLRVELTVVDGKVVPRTVDGFLVYSVPLARRVGRKGSQWPGLERVSLLRLDPSFPSGTFDIGFFGVSRR